MDGTGSPWYRADLGIKNGVIVANGGIAHSDVDRVIDAGGMIVSPGFIDMPEYLDEVVGMARVAARYGGYHGTHIGSEGFDITRELEKAL